MQKHLIIILLSLIFGLSSLVESQTMWTKYPGNPVLEPGPSGQWDYSLLAPSILHKDNLYHMWYGMAYTSPYPRLIGYATSPDGIIWTKYNDPATTNPPYSFSDPVIQAGSPGEWDEDISEPSVLWNENDSLFHMWYMAGTPAPYDARIGYATSPNGTTWTKYDDPSTTNPPYAESDPVLFPGPTGSWDASWVGGPWVLLIGNEYHMWYHAYSGSGNITRIGHATSHDGITWAKDINNPVLEPNLGSWDYPDLRRASVVFMESDSLYHMFYSGGIYSSTNWQVGHATTVHPDSTWHKDMLNNPVVPRGPVGSWDALSASFCGVLVENSNHVKMWYSGTNDGIIAQFGLAISPVVLNVPGNFSTIQAAIDAANDGNIVLVEEGTYYENINFKGKAITVGSRFLVDGDTSHISNTIIDGSQPTNPDSGSVVYFVSGEDTTSVLKGFTLTGGTGLWANEFGYIFRGGGAITCLGGGKIEHNKIVNNSVSSPSTNALGGGIIAGLIDENLIIKSNNISSCTADGNRVFGGGIYIYSTGTSHVKIIDNLITDNEITASGPHTIGGGIACEGTSIPWNLKIVGNTISHNRSINPQPSDLSYGGGVHIIDAKLQLTDNKIIGNTVLLTNIIHGAGLRISDSDSSIIERNIITSNYPEPGHLCYGGGIDLYQCNATFLNNLIINNTASYGGGMNIDNIEAYLEKSYEEINFGAEKNSHFHAAAFGSESTDQQKYRSENSDLLDGPVLINNTFIGNEATINGGGIFVNYPLSDTIKVINSILWGDTSPNGSEIFFYTGSVKVLYSDVEGGYSGEGNIDADPLLHDTLLATGDTMYCCLAPNSPLIDAGNPDTSSNDIQDPQNPGYALWPAMGTVVNDMGAYGGHGSTNVNVVFTEINAKESQIVKKYQLHQNYPNPFNPSTTIQFDLPKAGKVTLKVFNILGEDVATLVSDRLASGSYSYEWSSTAGIASGVYLYRLEAGNYVETRKMILMK